MLTIESVKDCKFDNIERSSITMVVKFKEFSDFIPFGAYPNDCEEHGRLLYNNALNGLYGEVAEYVKPFIPLDIQKKIKKEQLKKDRDIEAYKAVYTLDRNWDTNEASQTALISAINLAKLGLALPPYWRDADNDNMPITDISQLITILNSISSQIETAHINYWNKLKLVEEATTSEELELI